MQCPKPPQLLPVVARQPSSTKGILWWHSGPRVEISSEAPIVVATTAGDKPPQKVSDIGVCHA